jgi:hypothetical protein
MTLPLDTHTVLMFSYENIPIVSEDAPHQLRMAIPRSALEERLSTSPEPSNRKPCSL